VVGLFDRTGSSVPVTKSVDFTNLLGLQGAAQVRDLWAHEDLGSMTSWKVALGPYASSLVKVTPPARANYQAEVGAWFGTARFDNRFGGYEGFGYVTGLDTSGASVAVCVSVPAAGRYRFDCSVANATGARASLTVSSSDPETGQTHGTSRLAVSTTSSWSSWQTVGVTLPLATGDNLITLQHAPSDVGSVNVDHLALMGE
jgi:alpha-glucosidase